MFASKYWLVWLLGVSLIVAPARVAAVDTPEIDSPVVDRAGVISTYQEEYLGERLREHYEQTGVQMAVLLVDSTGVVPIETYSLRVAQQWEGGRVGEDRGVLLTLAIKDRRSRLEVGYGLEYILTDTLSARILADMREPLRARNYYGAVDDAVDEVISRTDHLEPGGMALPSLDNWWEGLARGFWTALVAGWIWMALMQLLRRREVRYFRDDRGRWVIAGAVAAGAVALGLLTTGVMWQGYVLVFLWGNLLAVGLSSDDAFVWAVPLVTYVVLGMAMLAWPGLARYVIASTESAMFHTIFLHIFLVMLSYSLWFAFTQAGTGGGRSSSYSSSGYSGSSGGFSGGGGYSGGGGSFGGGGASGGW